MSGSHGYFYGVSDREGQDGATIGRVSPKPATAAGNR